MKLRTRFYIGRDLVRADQDDVEPENLVELGQQHAAWMDEMAGEKLWIVEVEVLDDPSDPGRFVRFGTDEAGMVNPQLLP